MSHHTPEEMEAFAKKHNMTVEELTAHLKEHESMQFPETHKILMEKKFSEEEIEIMAKEHGMTAAQLKEHIALAKQHHA